MKKIYLFIAAALCCVASVKADIVARNVTFIDSVPAKTYFTNIKYDIKTGEISFTDNFLVGENLERRYHVWVYRRGEEMRMYSHQPWTGYVYYDYGYPYGQNQWYTSKVSDQCALYIANNSKGGEMSSRDLNMITYTSIPDILEWCIAHGYSDLKLVIEAMYGIPSGGYIHYTNGDITDPEKRYLNEDLDITLPRVYENTLSAPTNVNYGEEIVVESTIRTIDKCQYFIQESNDGGASWTTKKSGSLNTAEAREGVNVTYKRIITGNHETILFRTRVNAFEAPYGYIHTDTTEVKTIRVSYPFTLNGNTTWYQAGLNNINYTKPMDCRDYRYTSTLPLKVEEHDTYLTMTMPACPVTIDEITPTYTITYLNADYSWLDKVEVECGDDATNLGPTKPEYGDYTFIGWNKDLTNVHKNMTVVAKYDIGSNYWLNVAVTDHKNEVFPFEGFANSETRAMVGDKMTFTADIFATSNATLYYETAQWSAADSAFNWLPNSGKKVADYTEANKERWFDQEISICYDENTSYIHPFEYKVGVRFFLVIAGTRVYSAPIEIDVYYPLRINSNTGDAVFAENNFGDFTQELSTLFPARYNDTVRVISINGADGGCLDFERQAFPERPLFSDVDENGKAFFICPGEKETINVSVSKVAVVFDGAYPTQSFDFTAQGLGKHTAYYAEVVNCGGSVLHMPEDPTDEGYVFTGWKAWLDDYADDDYLHVPSGVGNSIGFAAQWEEIPAVDTFDVKFFGKDSVAQIGATQRIAEGENAVPPTAPEVSGYHFVGWNKPYTTITANTEIVALYGEDGITWTVTYKNWDNSLLGTEQVNDGEAAQGVVATREGYSFIGWSEDISHVTSDMTVTAQFKKTVYLITYTMDGETIFSEEVEHGEMPTAHTAIEAQGKPSTEQYTYTFDHWNPAIVAATADATYEAIFTQALRKYNVRFQNWNHALLKEQQVAYGQSASAPANPTREGYAFKGWDRDFSDVRAELTVTAVFEKGNGEQGIEDIIAPADQAAKVLIDGALYIVMPDGRILNALGQSVR